MLRTKKGVDFRNAKTRRGWALGPFGRAIRNIQRAGKRQPDADVVRHLCPSIRYLQRHVEHPRPGSNCLDGFEVLPIVKPILSQNLTAPVF